MPPEPPPLNEDDVIARGGWHPRYARVLAVATDAETSFALVDGNGDGAELDAAIWYWDDHQWVQGSSNGAGPIDHLGPCQTGGIAGDAYFAYGSAPGRTTVNISFDDHLHQVAVSQFGAWAFLKHSTTPNPGFPSRKP